MQNFKHWKLDKTDNNIMWVIMDRADQSVNSWNREVFIEFDRVLDEIIVESPRGVIITSGKSKGFIAGADISQFIHLTDPEKAFELIRESQLILDKLERLSVPTLALINGFCLGGGLEVALACRYRIAEDKQETRIGLPEVKLGIHPGWGGTVRLPKLIGVINAMGIILPGKDVSAKAAEKLGIVDLALPTRELKRAAEHFILTQPKPHEPNGVLKLLNLSVIRPLIGQLFRYQLRRKIKEYHYPAPYVVINNWVNEGIGRSAYLTEAKSIAALLATQTAQNLVRVFFLQTRLKGLGKSAAFKPQWVHVIGAGTMGGDIAAWCALRGLRVTLQDQSSERIAPAIKRAYQLYKKKLKNPRLIQAVMDRFQPDVEGYGVAKADVVIEAIFENLEAKQNLFRSIEPRLKNGAILATNTSSIPLEELAKSLKRPECLVGIHFFNPVAKMPLVEVVSGAETDQMIAEQALSFISGIGRFPLPVKSAPGFLVNRVLMPYLLEAMVLLGEGVPAEAIDQAAIEFGMPMGPITLADKVGLDICLSVAENLVKSIGGEVPERLRAMVGQGHLGCKSGEGFYRYQKGKKIKSWRVNRITNNPDDMIDRLILRMANEAVNCLHEKIVMDSDLLDAGMIFGTGFAPFRGGVVQYARQRGVDNVMNTLEVFSRKYGDRFTPASGWKAL